MNENDTGENKRVSKIKQQVLNPKGFAPMMTGSKYVGMMNELILKKEFKNKEEWEDFYYRSGKERLDKINKFIKEKQEELKKSGSKRKNVPKSWIKKFILENNLLEGYGRTEVELNKLGERLHKSISTKVIPSHEKYIRVAKEITLEDCQDYIKEVVIDKNWFIDAIDVKTRFMVGSKYAKARNQKELKEVLSGIKEKPCYHIMLIQ